MGTTHIPMGTLNPYPSQGDDANITLFIERTRYLTVFIETMLISLCLWDYFYWMRVILFKSPVETTHTPLHRR
jgi:hypothetical protein